MRYIHVDVTMLAVTYFFLIISLLGTLFPNSFNWYSVFKYPVEVQLSRSQQHLTYMVTRCFTKSWLFWWLPGNSSNFESHRNLVQVVHVKHPVVTVLKLYGWQALLSRIVPRDFQVIKIWNRILLKFNCFITKFKSLQLSNFNCPRSKYRSLKIPKYKWLICLLLRIASF